MIMLVSSPMQNADDGCCWYCFHTGQSCRSLVSGSNGIFLPVVWLICLLSNVIGWLHCLYNILLIYSSFSPAQLKVSGCFNLFQNPPPKEAHLCVRVRVRIRLQQYCMAWIHDICKPRLWYSSACNIWTWLSTNCVTNNYYCWLDLSVFLD